jgi:hypothetical protein
MFQEGRGPKAEIQGRATALRAGHLETPSRGQLIGSATVG